MGAAMELQAKGALEAAASRKRDRSKFHSVLRSLGKSQTAPFTPNPQIWENGCSVSFLVSFSLCGSHGGLDLAGGFVGAW